MILDIKTYADALVQEIRNTLQSLASTPRLTIVMVGENSASAIYVKNKIKTCETIGIGATLLHLPADTTQRALIEQIRLLNDDPLVHGILVQSPLPKQIDAQTVFDVINPLKDVDGFCSANTSRLYSGDESGLVPGTPKGVMKICFAYFQMQSTECIELRSLPLNIPLGISPVQNNGIGNNKNPQFGILNFELGTHSKILAGKHAVIIGKSTIVGKPLAMLLLNSGVTVTICHSRTRDLASHTRNADIVISAVGKKHLITADMIRPGSLVIDVGINVEETEGGRKLSGDCDTENIAEIADITPVPGGVGPMTIAMLLSNVMKAYEMQRKKK